MQSDAGSECASLTPIPNGQRPMQSDAGSECISVGPILRAVLNYSQPGGMNDGETRRFGSNSLDIWNDFDHHRKRINLGFGRNNVFFWVNSYRVDCLETTRERNQAVLIVIDR